MKIRKKVLGILQNDLQKEMREMCLKKSMSVLRASSPEALQTFSWESVVEELQVKAPTLLHLLKGCADVKRHERPRKSRRKSPKSFRPTNTAVLGTCAAILLRHKNQYMNLLQRLVSLVL